MRHSLQEVRLPCTKEVQQKQPDMSERPNTKYLYMYKANQEDKKLIVYVNCIAWHVVI